METPIMDKFEVIKQVLTSHLERMNLRKTQERYTILKEIYSIDGHFDIESLYIKLKNNKYRVSKATLYNTLEVLLACKLVVKHQFGQNVAQFEKAYSDEPHDHLLCIDCRKVVEFFDPKILEIKKNIEDKFGLVIEHHSLAFYGRCVDQDKCKNMKTSKEKTKLI